MFKDLPQIEFCEFDLEEFREKYLMPEKPVVIRGLPLDSYNNLDVTETKKRFEIEENKRHGFYDAKIAEDLVPNMVSEILATKGFGIRSMPMRIFMHPKGHKTLAHYDGNSIHGLNLQIQGEKLWKIYSPQSKPRMLPFMYLTMDSKMEVEKEECFEFSCSPGDMLFLPRYWIHEVESKAEKNINLNWVFTPSWPSDSNLGRREREIVKLRLKLPLINKAFFPDDIRFYGGLVNGPKEYLEKSTSFEILKRLFSECFNYIFLPFYYRRLRSKVDEFKGNNFNL